MRLDVNIFDFFLLSKLQRAGHCSHSSKMSTTRSYLQKQPPKTLRTEETGPSISSQQLLWYLRSGALMHSLTSRVIFVETLSSPPPDKILFYPLQRGKNVKNSVVQYMLLLGRALGGAALGMLLFSSKVRTRRENSHDRTRQRSNEAIGRCKERDKRRNHYTCGKRVWQTQPIQLRTPFLTFHTPSPFGLRVFCFHKTWNSRSQHLQWKQR